MKKQIKSLTFIVPCLNEEGNISLFMDQVLEIRESYPNINFRVMFVDDGSTDDSRAIIRKLSREHADIGYVFLTRNFGSHYAMLAGLESSFTETAVFISCDQPNNLDLVPQMFNYAAEGAEVIVGKRKNKNENIISSFFSRAFYFLLNLIGDVKLPLSGLDFILITRRPMEFLLKNKEYDTNIFMLLLWPGFKSKTFEIENMPRKIGKSKWTFAKRLRLAMDSFCGFSMVPLRVITFAGLFLSTISFLFMIYTIWVYFYIDTPVPGIATVVCSIALGFGCTFLALGIIAEYLHRDLAFSRKRPIYVVDEQSENGKQGNTFDHN